MQFLKLYNLKDIFGHKFLLVMKLEFTKSILDYEIIRHYCYYLYLLGGFFSAGGDMMTLEITI